MRGVRLLLIWITVGLFGSICPVSAAVTTFVYRSAETLHDTRNGYDMALLRLALEKTRDVYGEFELLPSPVMNTTRVLKALQQGTYPNFIIKMSYSPEYEHQGLLRGGYELDLGIVGYRVCYTRRALLPQLASRTTLAAWQLLSYGQGTGWMDVDILRANEFLVAEVPNYKNLFPMTAMGRFDLFCRGINEIPDELAEIKRYPEIVLEPMMMLYYDLPRFFYANPRDSAGLERVEKGIRLAAADGSLQQLWLHFNQPGIDYVHPAQRQLFRLKNPLLKDLHWAPDQLIYNLPTGRFEPRTAHQ